jgi:hypothetical protein
MGMGHHAANSIPVKRTRPDNPDAEDRAQVGVASDWALLNAGIQAMRRRQPRQERHMSTGLAIVSLAGPARMLPTWTGSPTTGAPRWHRSS